MFKITKEGGGAHLNKFRQLLLILCLLFCNFSLGWIFLYSCHVIGWRHWFLSQWERAAANLITNWLRWRRYFQGTWYYRNKDDNFIKQRKKWKLIEIKRQYWYLKVFNTIGHKFMLSTNLIHIKAFFNKYF